MPISYKPLWRQLVNRDMKKTDLINLIGSSSATITKMGKGGYVALEVIERICKELQCQPGDIIEYIEENPYEKD